MTRWWGELLYGRRSLFVFLVLLFIFCWLLFHCLRLLHSGHSRHTTWHSGHTTRHSGHSTHPRHTTWHPRHTTRHSGHTTHPRHTTRWPKWHLLSHLSNSFFLSYHIEESFLFLLCAQLGINSRLTANNDLSNLAHNFLLGLLVPLGNAELKSACM